MTKISLNLVENINLQIQKVRLTPSRINTKQITLVEITVEFEKAKEKDKIFKAARGKQHVT
jgi:hypothetical protein